MKGDGEGRKVKRRGPSARRYPAACFASPERVRVTVFKHRRGKGATEGAPIPEGHVSINRRVMGGEMRMPARYNARSPDGPKARRGLD